MAIETTPDLAHLFVRNRAELARLAEEVNARAGITGEPEMTPEQLQEAMRARGVRPDDNIGSSELMRMRCGDDWEKE